jgi:S1-C subfamily serine protease
MKTALALTALLALATPKTSFDFEASKVTSLKALEQCTVRVSISNVYSINDHYELVQKGQASLATIGEDEDSVYFLTNSHVVDHAEPAALLRENIIEVRGAMGAEGISAPLSSINVRFIRTHAKLTDADDKELPQVNLDLLVDDATRDIALLSVSRSSFGKYTLCPAFGDSDQLERGHVLYSFGYGKGDALMTRGIYSGTIISPKLMDGSITNGYSGSGVYALKDGKPLYVGLPSIVVYDNPKYGGFISSNSIKLWLEMHDKENILISPGKK